MSLERCTPNHSLVFRGGGCSHIERNRLCSGHQLPQVTLYITVKIFPYNRGLRKSPCPLSRPMNQIRRRMCHRSKLSALRRHFIHFHWNSWPMWTVEASASSSFIPVQCQLDRKCTEPNQSVMSSGWPSTRSITFNRSERHCFVFIRRSSFMLQMYPK